MEISGWDAAVVIAKAFSYASTLCAAGEVLFLGYCRDLLSPVQQRTLRASVYVLSALALLAGVLKISLLAGSITGELSGMIDRSFAGMILDAGEGRATGTRIVGLLLMNIAVSRPTQAKVPAVLGALLAATSFGWTGHAHALLPNVAPTMAVFLHLTCIAFWLGALPPLWWLTNAGDSETAAQCTLRFARWAVGVVAAMSVAGVFLLYALLDTVSDLWTSAYGRFIVAKLVLVAMLLAAAAVNKWRLTPRMLDGEPNALAQLKRSIQLELLLAAGILLATATFTTLSGPPR